MTAEWTRVVRNYESQFEPSLTLSKSSPFFFDNDCYYWVNYAQRMARDGMWRIRDAEVDNAPFGREMHWSQSLAELESGFGKVRAWFTGDSWLEAISQEEVCVNPVMFLITV